MLGVIVTLAASCDGLTGFLDNSSAAALIGAFSAYLLVAVNDWRRRRRSKKQIRFLIDDNTEHARAKLRTVQTALEMLAESRFSPAPIMRFSIDAISAKRIEVIDLLDSNENRSLDALLYWMTSIDDLLSRYSQSALDLRRAVESQVDNETRTRLAQRMKVDLNDAARNLEILARMSDAYVGRRFHEILEIQVPISNR